MYARPAIAGLPISTEEASVIKDMTNGQCLIRITVALLQADDKTYVYLPDDYARALSLWFLYIFFGG